MLSFKKVYLPLPQGTKFLISQGAFGQKSHHEAGNQYSWDFDVPYKTLVTAVQSGKVLEVWEPKKGGGCDPKYSNFAHNIKIEHDDGTVAQYVHIESKVSKGDRVEEGQIIAITAKNGWICGPQLHFGIYASKNNLYSSPQRKTLPLFFYGLLNGKASPQFRGEVPSLINFPTQKISFKNGRLDLQGILYKPIGKGPFPAVLYNHGSAKDSSLAAKTLGPVFTSRGWIFFMPDRRGQGASSSMGPYIMDEIDKARQSGGEEAAVEKLIRLQTHEHLSDQLAALKWLKRQPYVRSNSVAVHGNSFGGIQTIFGAERGMYCAAIDASGAAQSWSSAPQLQKVLISSVEKAKAPIFFFQAENDFDLTPSTILSGKMQSSGKECKLKFYPPYGSSPSVGHSFAYLGSSVWIDDVMEFLNMHCKNNSGKAQ